MTRLTVLLCGFVSLSIPFPAEAQVFELKQGDAISIVGSTLPERMQHDGYLETLIHRRFPEHQLKFRNLAFSADELTVQLRSAGFGSQDEHLAAHKTDVIFAFWGFNESFAGPAGLDKFKADLEAFVNHVRGQKYNDKSAPRVVLFSPIAWDDETAHGIPGAQENDPRLALYVAAMKEVAARLQVPFVDLFTPSQQLFRETRGPLTINGIHLTSEGNRLLAPAIDRALFGERKATSDWSELEPLRQAVVDKNFYWFHRYRTTDGYSSYGGRSYLKFVDDQTNREVMMRELEILDGMTSNRDRRVWAYAQGKDHAVDDSNLPPFIEVISNKTGPGPNGEHLFLSGEDSIRQMTVHKNMSVNLFADEAQFPELINPVQMAVDLKGRIWVAVWPSYPHWKPDEEMNDKLLILEDTDGDGRADNCKVFADKLHNPTGFEFWNGGVLVAVAPDVVFLKDTNGDDVADVRERVLHGIDSADTHHAANSFVFDAGGGVYFQEGVFHRTQSETPYGPQRNFDACVWRFDPRTYKFERYIPYGFANPHGHVFDRWGQDIVHDGTGANPYHGTVVSGYLPFPQKHPGAPQVYRQRTRPCSSTEILSSQHFPKELQGNLLAANVIGFQGILQYELREKGSSIEGTEVEPIVSSTDPNFRPADIEIGSDGAIYFTDWHNPIIGHMQHNLRDPSRDKKHGRVYRVTYNGAPLLKNPKIDGASAAELVELLDDPNDRVRYRARLALTAIPAADVLAAATAWLARQDKSVAEYEHQRLEVLWLHQSHDIVNVELLKQVLGSPDHRARAAAVKVVSYWRDRVPGALELLVAAAADESAPVRLEAVRAASFFTQPEAIEIPIVAAELGTDEYLDYVRTETLKVLEPQWKTAEAAGHKTNFTTSAGRRFFLRNVDSRELVTLPRNEAVFDEFLFREGIADQYRNEALAGLAQLHNISTLQVLLDTIRGLDQKQRDVSVVYDLVRLLTSRQQTELEPVRNQLVEMATTSGYPVVRQIGYVALISADNSVEPAWTLATSSIANLRDFLSALPLVLDPSVRTALYPRVKALLTELPAGLAGANQGGGVYGRYVRIELPGNNRTLTLAEVEVLSDGKNIAPQGRASQINTSHGGDAKRAIDGVNSGLFGMNGQTHTAENTKDPWWELDLGEERSIEGVQVWNRREGDLGKRLEGFTLKILDAGRNVVFEKKGVPAPDRSVKLDLDGEGSQGVVRRTAMNALVTVRGYERESFDAIKPFALTGRDRVAAMRALQKIPRQDWPVEEAKPLADSVLAFLAAIPEADRRNPSAIEALQFGELLASLLPASDAARVREQLGQLGVQVVRLATLPHRMSYDQERIVVQAGKTVEFIFENPDLMPHNFVIVQRGALEEIGLLAEANAQKPEFAAADYVPQSNQVLLASRLLAPQDSQTFSFQVPNEPGVYPFVCTYPGHWRRMYGALYVVENRQEYLADTDAYLAAHPLEPVDEMLKFLRPRKEWALEELVASLPLLEEGRSFENARQIFTVANCVGCHKLNGVGNELGPDLSKLELDKYKPADIVRDILEPSWRINEKYESWTVLLDDGKIVTGMLLKEDDQSLTLIENPLAKTPPVTLAKSAIEERKKSLTSIMPKGLLDRLRREEILDLLAYVISRGNAKSPLFGDGHGHHGH